MILTRFSSNALIRASAILSVLLGLLYLPSNHSLPIIGLGPELAGGQQLAVHWAMYAMFGGACIFVGSFLLNMSRSIGFKRFILALCLISTFLLIAAQLPPLFWWMFVGGAVFSWSSVLGFCLHLSLLLLAMWGAVITIHALER
ncbi:hypothetical protein ACF3MZ_10980 [Paenibacillaceae bacterium WGS1546]|uniref:hypothetical protein n=1 Tax=Cohnella sp. WGS1546 TaxID=3366810 RepID=UPI00372D02F2